MKKIQSDRIQFWRPQGHTRTLFFLTLKNFLSLQSVVFFSLFLSLSRIQRGTGRRVLNLLQTVVCERRTTTTRRRDETLKQKRKKKKEIELFKSKCRLKKKISTALSSIQCQYIKNVKKIWRIICLIWITGLIFVSIVDYPNDMNNAC